MNPLAQEQEQIYSLYNQGWEKVFINMNEAVQDFETARELSLIANAPIGIAKYKVNMSVVHRRNLGRHQPHKSREQERNRYA